MSLISISARVIFIKFRTPSISSTACLPATISTPTSQPTILWTLSSGFRKWRQRNKARKPKTRSLGQTYRRWSSFRATGKAPAQFMPANSKPFHALKISVADFQSIPDGASKTASDVALLLLLSALSGQFIRSGCPVDPGRSIFICAG